MMLGLDVLNVSVQCVNVVKRTHSPVIVEEIGVLLADFVADRLNHADLIVVLFAVFKVIGIISDISREGSCINGMKRLSAFIHRDDFEQIFVNRIEAAVGKNRQIPSEERLKKRQKRLSDNADNAFGRRGKDLLFFSAFVTVQRERAHAADDNNRRHTFRRRKGGRTKRQRHQDAQHEADCLFQ